MFTPSRIPGTEIGVLDSSGQRFLDSRRIEGNLLEMLDSAVSFLRGNMRTALKIDPATGKREDIPEYPVDAVREAVLNALVRRDYSTYTENMPIQLTMFSDRLEIRNPGRLYGRICRCFAEGLLICPTLSLQNSTMYGFCTSGA